MWYVELQMNVSTNEIDMKLILLLRPSSFIDTSNPQHIFFIQLWRAGQPNLIFFFTTRIVVPRVEVDERTPASLPKPGT